MSAPRPSPGLPPSLWIDGGHLPDLGRQLAAERELAAALVDIARTASRAAKTAAAGPEVHQAAA